MKFLLPAIFLLILATVLIGQRFGFVWAGGEGYVAQRVAVMEEAAGTPEADRNGTAREAGAGTEVRRGETVRTAEGERVRLRLADGYEVSLDENTDATIVSNTRDGIELKLTRGRAYAKVSPGNGSVPLVILTNFTRSRIDEGAASVVNYDFLETVSVAPIDGSTVILSLKGDDARDRILTSALNIHETDPVSIAEIPFDISAPAVAEFYAWARGQKQKTGP